MLAVCGTGTLSLLDATVLKQAPSSAPACLPLVDAVISSAWSTDNTVLFLASSWVIHRYDPASNILRNIYTSSSTDPISHIVCKDKATLILSAGNKVDILECGSTPKITQSLESHKSPITSLSLSNDATLLASTTSNAVHIHNLTLGSHTVLRGIPSSSGGSGITTAVFHPHTRTRLLVGIGKQVLVYDTTRPASSIKSISLNEASSGEIAVVACSPFSKTLVAVATSGGHLGLIDLDKEKGLFRTLNVKVPLTTLGFSPEGAALYLGTEHGKLLVMDLRSLDKAPKAITISEVGCRIETMSVQKKIKGGEINAKPQPSTISTNLTRKSSTQSSRVVSTASPARRVTSTTSKDPIGGTIKATPTRPITTAKKIFSPVRDPLGNSPGDISVEIQTLKGPSAKSTPLKSDRIKKQTPSISPAVQRRVSSAASPRVTSLSAVSSRTNGRGSATQDNKHETQTQPPARTTTRVTRTTSSTSTTRLNAERPRAGSSTSTSTSKVRAGSVSTSPTTRQPGSSTSASRPSSQLRHEDARPPRDIPLPASRTPSPDHFPDLHADANYEPATPVPIAKKSLKTGVGRINSGKGMGVLGMGTPEVDRWIRAGREVVIEREGDGRGKGKGKTVGFKDSSDEDDGDGDKDKEEYEPEREKSLSMQISPRRPSTAWQASPVYQSPLNLNPNVNVSTSGGSGSGLNTPSSAHDLLRTIIKDVLYDYQQETRNQMTGLHLDLVSMGRGWKKELRDVMGGFEEGLRELREENRKLREENERLRRGF